MLSKAALDSNAAIHQHLGIENIDKETPYPTIRVETPKVKKKEKKYIH